MSHSPKLEILGQVSERARQLEDGRDPIDQLLDAVLVVMAGRDLPWLDFRPLVELLAASSVNALLAGDVGHGRRVRAIEEFLDLDIDLGQVVG